MSDKSVCNEYMMLTKQTQGKESPAQTRYQMSLRTPRTRAYVDVCCVCLCSSTPGAGELKACSRCHTKYHEECHEPYIENIYIANAILNWYCSPCSKKGWRSDTPHVQRFTSYEEAGIRQRKRPRTEDVGGKTDQTAELTSDTISAYKQEQRREQRQEGQDINAKRQEQQPISLQKEWRTIFSVLNKHMRVIDRHFKTKTEELEGEQREVGDMTDLRQKMNDATQRIMALEQDVKDRDETILALEQASRDQLRVAELNKQVEELKAKLAIAKELYDEAAKAEQARALRAQSVFAFDQSPTSSSR